MLGVQAGVIALTKSDLVDSDLLELVRLEVDEFVAGSFLGNAATVAVSSTTGEGLPELRKELEQTARGVREKSAGGWFRLPIDRAFTMKGFGTVVTGTLISGTLQREQEVELYPLGRRLRVRGLQVYGERADRARAGERTAVNLPEIDAAEIERGMILGEAATRSSMSRAAMSAPAKEASASGCWRSIKPLKNRTPVHIHIGSAEIEAEVRMLVPGMARIVLREPALVLPGDRFIIRNFSPVTTIGGGVVADIGGHKYRRAEDIAGRLKILLEGDARARMELVVGESPCGIVENELIALTGLRELPPSTALETAGKWRISRTRSSDLRQKLTAEVRQFHKKETLLRGIHKQDLKGRVIPAASGEIFEHLLAADPDLVQDGELVRLKSYKVVLKLDEEQARGAIEMAFERAGLTAPAVQDVLRASGLEPARARSILQILLREGRLLKVSDELVLHTASIVVLREQLAGKNGTRFSVPEFKEWTGVSRKYEIPMLEYLDREHVTRRDGDERVVL